MGTGDLVKKLRVEKGLTLKEFGRLFNPPASDSIVSRWEKGKSEPSVKRLSQLNKMVAPTPSVEIIKTKNGRPTVIEYDGHRYILQHPNQYERS